MTFELHSNLKSKTWVLDLPLSSLLLEDNAHYPWLILVPRKPNISKIIDLTHEDQLLLLSEMVWAQTFLWEKFKPTQLNVAALGNKTPQLHMHIIARNKDDPAWPGAVFDHPAKKAYSPEKKEEIIFLMRSFCSKKLFM